MAYNRRQSYKPSVVCKEPQCTKIKKISCGGYCEDHEQLDPGYARKQAKAALKKLEPKVRMLIPSNDYKLVENTAAMEFQLLENWFADARRELSIHPFCAECGALIPSVYFRAASCHILPKRKEFGFPSVQAHPLNRIFLGPNCGCHNKFDNCWDDAAKMKVWNQIVIPAFKEFHPFIHPSELKNLPDILRVEMI